MTGRRMDPLDKALTTRTYTTAQLESVSRAAILRLSHSPSQVSGSVGVQGPPRAGLVSRPDGHALRYGPSRPSPVERISVQPSSSSSSRSSSSSHSLRAESLARGRVTSASALPPATPHLWPMRGIGPGLPGPVPGRLPGHVLLPRHAPRVPAGVRVSAAARTAPRRPGGLGAWSAAVSHDLAAVRQALNEPPQRLVQAALDHWIAADSDVRRP